MAVGGSYLVSFQFDQLLKKGKCVCGGIKKALVTSDHSTSLTINSVLEWKNAATEVAPIPKGFNLETLTNYLREIPCNLAMQDEEELVYSGTQKPVLKGRKMYQSMKLQMAQFGVAGTDLFFRANCSASLKNKETRYPSVRISHEGAVWKDNVSALLTQTGDAPMWQPSDIWLKISASKIFLSCPKLPLMFLSVGEKGENEAMIPNHIMSTNTLRREEWIVIIILTLALTKSLQILRTCYKVYKVYTGIACGQSF